MPNPTFGRETTIDELLEGVDLSGRRVLVTGGSAGLGAETARALAAHGAHVIMPVRDLAKGERAAAVAREAARLGGTVELCELDLASLASVRACADRLVAAGAAAARADRERGRDGVPAGQDARRLRDAVRHQPPRPLRAREPARAAPAARRAEPDRGALVGGPPLLRRGPRRSRTSSARPTIPWVAYGRAKTANVLFAVELDRRLRTRGVRAAAVHPGGIRTELGRHLTPETMAAL